MNNNKIIGVVGGLDLYVGLDLVKKIYDNTLAIRDQDYIDIILFSKSNITDRTEFLLGIEQKNPADEIFEVINELESVGTSIVGIPCNTTHSSQIFSSLVHKLKCVNSKVRLINMIESVGEYILDKYSNVNKIGLLSTTGTFKSSRRV